MLIRREAAGDEDAIRAVTAAAFARPGQPRLPPETGLIDALRVGEAWLPLLSLIAVGPGSSVIGHVLCTRGHVAAAPVLALGPLSVHPSHQARGVGSALMHAVLGAADALGEPLVALLGAPGFYGRFGFRLGTEHAILPPVQGWQPYFQVRTLTTYRPGLRGTFRYPAPFDDLPD